MTKKEAIEKVANQMMDSDWIQYGEFHVGAERILDFILDELMDSYDTWNDYYYYRWDEE